MIKWRWRKLTNKFFMTDDEKLENLDDFVIPKEWWSRPYEYAFAEKFLKADEVIIDAGCGIEHPFKYFASKRTKKVYAIDRDERLKALEGNEKLEFVLDRLEKFKLAEKADKIFCISVLEHIPNPQLVIDNFYNNLTDGGQLILTVDFPLLKPELLLMMLKNKFTVGKTKYKESENDLYSQLYYLKCYSLTATKKKVEKKSGR